MSRSPLLPSRALIAVAAIASLAGITGCETVVHQTSSSTTTSGTGGGGGAPDTSSSTDASSSVSTGTGIGEPSNTYPAPHPTAPVVLDFGGPVLSTPKIVPIYYSNDTAAMKSSIAEFTNNIGATDYWTAVTAEYGVGPAVGLTPVEIAGNAPTSLTDAQIQAFLGSKLNADDPSFPAPDGQTLYALYYPTGTSITLQGSKSCQEFGGYHAEFNLDAAHGNKAVPYAVMPRCTYPGETALETLTVTASHEYIEAATDPFPYNNPALAQTDNNHIYWLFALGGGETGDMCAQNPTANAKFTPLNFLVQRSWSNAAAKASHDPCQPALPGHVYFNAAPVFKDTLNLGMGIGNVKGVQIPVGESKTIDVDLFSDADTNGPFTVQAFDQSAFFGGAPELEFSFDENKGENGQVLHLTITVLKANQFNAEVFYLLSSKGTDQNLWIGIVGN